MKKNYVQEIEARITELNARKQADMRKALEAKAAAEKAVKAAQATMEEATDKLELERYAEAKQQKEEAETALAMFEGKCKKVEQKVLVTDEDSEAVIEGILSYEEQLEREFLDAIRKPIEELRALQEDHWQKVAEAERIMNRWTSEIHANYISCMRRRDAETGEWTSKVDYPVPVRVEKYLGCPASKVIRDFLKSGRLANTYGGRT